MVQRSIRCPSCYWRITCIADLGDQHLIDMHRLSGLCRAAVPPKERKAPRKRPEDGQLDLTLGGF